MHAINVPSNILKEVVTGLKGSPCWRNREHRHVLLEKGEGTLRFTATDGKLVMTYLRRIEPQPLTTLARRMTEARWEREGTLTLLVPFEFLTDRLTFTAEDCQLDPWSFPSPPLDTLREGWNFRNVAIGRADLRALAASY